MKALGEGNITFAQILPPITQKNTDTSQNIQLLHPIFSLCP